MRSRSENRNSNLNKTAARFSTRLLFFLAILIVIFFALNFYYFRLAQKKVDKGTVVATNTIEIAESNKKDYIKAGDLPMAGEHGLNMLFFGDMMLDRHVGEKIRQHGLDHIFKNIYGSTTDIFTGYDLISTNLEGAVTDKGEHYKPDQAYDFSFAPELINKLHEYNFTYFNLANNHLSDQGERGIIETAKNLAKIGFLYSGCADGIVGSCSATTTVINNFKIGLIGYSLVYNEPDRAKMIAKVSEISRFSDLVVINIHWGVEYEHKFSLRQQELARALIDSGADIVIGHHPHVVQGMEIYKQKPIFYSLGNFIFDQYFSPDTQEELAVGITIAAEQMNIKLFPLQSKASQPILKSAAEKEIFLKKFIQWSQLENKYQEQVIKGEVNL